MNPIRSEPQEDPITFKPITDPIQTPCCKQLFQNHDSEGLHGWLAKSRTCPLCNRENLTVDQLIAVRRVDEAAKAPIQAAAAPSQPAPRPAPPPKRTQEDLQLEHETSMKRLSQHQQRMEEQLERQRTAQEEMLRRIQARHKDLANYLFRR